MYSHSGGSPAYSSCSSGELQVSRNDRQCMRCLIHKLESETQGDAFPTRSKFTRSFSVESNRSIEEMFRSSDDDFNAQGTKILFCKALNVTSDEEDDKKGIKRTFEDRQERKKPARYKRHCHSDDYVEKRRPTSRSSLRSDNSRKVPKRLPVRPSSGSKQKSKPASNRNLLTSSPEREIVLQNQTASRVPLKKNKYRLEDKEEVTIYEKTIITVTSSDNYLLGGPLRSVDNYKSEMSQISFQKMAKGLQSPMISEAYIPASIGVYGTGTKKSFRKGKLSRDSMSTRSNDMQILPVIQELNNMGADSSTQVVASRTKSAMSSDSEYRPKRPQRTTSWGTKNRGMLEKKSRTLGVQPTSQAATLFPNSCLKKETVKNSSKKSVRFMVSESQSNMGGENVPKKSLRLEKFPSGLSVKFPKVNDGMNTLTAAPVVLRIENMTLERMHSSMGRDSLENIIRRESAQTVVQEQFINQLDIIRNINAGGHSHHLLECTKSLSAPGEPFGLTMEGFNQEEFTNKSDGGDTTLKAKCQTLPGTGLAEGELHYTLSDLGIPRGKEKDEEVKNMRQKSNSEVVPRGRGKGQKTSSLEERRKYIRLKLHEPQLKDDETSSKSKELRETSGVLHNSGREKTVNSSKPLTKGSSLRKPQVNTNRNSLVSENLKADSVDGELVTNKKLGDLLPHLRRAKNQGSTFSKVANGGKGPKITRTVKEVGLNKKDLMNGGSTSAKAHSRPSTTGSKSLGSRESPMSLMSTMSGAAGTRSSDMQKSSSGCARARDNCESAIESRSPKGSGSRTESPSPNSKPYSSQVGRVVSRSPDRSSGAPRTPLTLKPNAQPDSKKTSTIREHLRSSQIKSGKDAQKNQPKRSATKLSGHPLKNKTLSEFLEQRKLNTDQSKRKVGEKKQKNF